MHIFSGSPVNHGVDFFFSCWRIRVLGFSEHGELKITDLNCCRYFF